MLVNTNTDNDVNKNVKQTKNYVNKCKQKVQSLSESS